VFAVAWSLVAPACALSCSPALVDGIDVSGEAAASACGGGCVEPAVVSLRITGCGQAQA
jgi:hypothetical protein